MSHTPTVDAQLAADLKRAGYTPANHAEYPWLPREQQLTLTPGDHPVTVRLTHTRITPDGHRDYHAVTPRGESVWITHHASAQGRGARTEGRLP